MQNSMSDTTDSGFVGLPRGGDVAATYSGVQQLGGSEITVTASAVRYGKKYFLKALREPYASQAMYRQMLDKEFDIVVRLNHPGVAQGVEKARVDPLGECLVMEWVEGVTLDRYLAGHPGRAEARRLVLQLLDAVEHIHRHGIAHRDLKPANIMVTDNGGQVKIVDFGLADTDAHLTLKQPAGTAGYMAPEQLTGRDADTRNDIYSLGVMMRGMNLGHRWQRVAERCLLPIDERWHSAEALREALLRADRRARRLGRMALAVLLAVLAASTIATGVTAFRGHRTSQRLRAANDSLLAAMDRLSGRQNAQQQALSQMNDSLTAVNNDNHALRQAQDERQAHERQMATAVARGKQLVDEAVGNAGVLRHLDTLSSMRYIAPDYSERCNAGLRAINAYVEHLGPSFSDTDRAEVYNQLIKYNADKWLTAINNKLKQVSAQ